MKVLVSDKINEQALNLLKDKNIDYDYRPEIPPDQLRASIINYSALVVRSRTKVTKEIVVSGKNLKVIGRVGSGVDNIDMEIVRKKGIVVVNAPSANSQAVSELTVGLMISLLRKLDQAYASMKQGLWAKKELVGQELCGKTVGIVGYGNIGKQVERLVTAFGAKVLIYSRSFKTCELPQLFSNADIITIHLTLTDQTKGVINKGLLTFMKPTAYFINLARGEIINEDDLYGALVNKKIAGAALDVFCTEPLPADSRFRKLDNCILTPHIGASTTEALKRASLTVVRDIVKVLKEERPDNEVK